MHMLLIGYGRFGTVQRLNDYYCLAKKYTGGKLCAGDFAKLSYSYLFEYTAHVCAAGLVCVQLCRHIRRHCGGGGGGGGSGSFVGRL